MTECQTTLLTFALVQQTLVLPIFIEKSATYPPPPVFDTATICTLTMPVPSRVKEEGDTNHLCYGTVSLNTNTLPPVFYDVWSCFSTASNNLPEHVKNEPPL